MEPEKVRPKLLTVSLEEQVCTLLFGAAVVSTGSGLLRAPSECLLLLRHTRRRQGW